MDGGAVGIQIGSFKFEISSVATLPRALPAAATLASTLPLQFRKTMHMYKPRNGGFKCREIFFSARVIKRRRA